MEMVRSMMKAGSRKRGNACCATMLLVVMVGLAPASASADSCLRSSPELVLQRGHSPFGVPWIATAKRHRNHGCQSALLEVSFILTPRGRDPIEWGGGSPLSPAGHLGSGFKITAAAAPHATTREGELVGYVTARAREINVLFVDGARRTIKARLPRRALRRQHEWLGNLRYFVMFFSPRMDVRAVVLKDDDGNAFYRAPNFGGSIF